jgi:ABC-type antimicrobial peptide transport system permease subunit
MTTPESITQIGRTSDSYIINDQSTELFVIGVNDNYFDVLQHKFISGRAINKQEIADEAPVAVLDRNTANLCFGKYEEAIGKTIDLSGIQYRVVGVMENYSFVNLINGIFANVIVPLNNKSFLNSTIMFTGKNKNSIADMQAEFARVLDEANTAEDTQYRIYEREKSSLEQQSSSIGIGALLVCLILMLIPAVNILSLNVSKSFERSEEIAIRKTFGAPVSAIFGQLFFENLLLTLAGAVIGMCLTPIVINAIDKMMLNNSMFPVSMSLYFDWKTILLVAVPCVLLFSFLSGSVPAYITAKREIVNVLKGEVQ